MCINSISNGRKLYTKPLMLFLKIQECRSCLRNFIKKVMILSNLICGKTSTPNSLLTIHLHAHLEIVQLEMILHVYQVLFWFLRRLSFINYRLVWRLGDWVSCCNVWWLFHRCQDVSPIFFFSLPFSFCKQLKALKTLLLTLCTNM